MNKCRSWRLAIRVLLYFSPQFFWADVTCICMHVHIHIHMSCISLSTRIEKISKSVEFEPSENIRPRVVKTFQCLGM